HQLDEASRLSAYAGEETLLVRALYQPALKQLGRTHDGVQRRLELMRDVRVELARETLGAQRLGHVHGQEHDAVLGCAGYHGAGGQHILALAAGDIALRLSPLPHFSSSSRTSGERSIVSTS